MTVNLNDASKKINIFIDGIPAEQPVGEMDGTTISEKMCIRDRSDMLSYKKKGTKSGKNIYGRRLVKIPTPHFVVFYNGEEEDVYKRQLKCRTWNCSFNGSYTWSCL